MLGLRLCWRTSPAPTSSPSSLQPSLLPSRYGLPRMSESNSAVRLPTLLLTPQGTKCTECAEALRDLRLTRFDVVVPLPSAQSWISLRTKLHKKGRLYSERSSRC